MCGTRLRREPFLRRGQASTQARLSVPIRRTTDNFRPARYPFGIGDKRINSHVYSREILSAPIRTISFELLRRSEQPTAVVHETICEQVHW